ncbi:MAG: outer membrane protein assembly factor BamA [Arcticibacterium sp.]|jgi:outer membrane protein assembly factor BamA
MPKRTKFLTLFFALFSQTLMAQVDSTQISSKLIRDKNALVLPVVFRLPETGWAAGVIATASWSWGKDKIEANPSQASFGITYTQNKQILVFLPFQVFIDNNEFYLNADLGWYKYNYFYHGVGESRVEAERFDVTFPHLELLAAKLIRPNLYLGVRMKYENYDVTGRQEAGELIKDEISGSRISRTSGVGPALLLDTRDNVFYPRDGFFGEISVFPSNKIFGADRNFVQTKVDVSKYTMLFPKLVMANNLYLVHTAGKDVPFQQLALFGGSKKMRGLYTGFFRDKNAALLQTELRYNVWKSFFLTVFGAVGVLGNSEDILRLALPKFTYGFGLRKMTQGGVNFRFDYGFSPYDTGNFYLTIGEAF